MSRKSQSSADTLYVWEGQVWVVHMGGGNVKLCGVWRRGGAHGLGVRDRDSAVWVRAEEEGRGRSRPHSEEESRAGGGAGSRVNGAPRLGQIVGWSRKQLVHGCVCVWGGGARTQLSTTASTPGCMGDTQEAQYGATVPGVKAAGHRVLDHSRQPASTPHKSRRHMHPMPPTPHTHGRSAPALFTPEPALPPALLSLTVEASICTPPPSLSPYQLIHTALLYTQPGCVPDYMQAAAACVCLCVHLPSCCRHLEPVPGLRCIPLC